MKTIKLKKNDCGKHSSLRGGACRKCQYFAELHSRPEFRRGLQYDGTSYIALLGPTAAELKFEREPGV